MSKKKNSEDKLDKWLQKKNFFLQSFLNKLGLKKPNLNKVHKFATKASLLEFKIASELIKRKKIDQAVINYVSGLSVIRKMFPDPSVLDKSIKDILEN